MLEEHTGHGDSRPGLLDSLRTLTATAVAAAHNRIELLSADFEEQWLRIGQLLLLASVALFCLGLGVVLASILIVVLFWDTHRIAVLAVLSVLFLGAAALAGSRLLAGLRDKPSLFAATLSELGKDHEHLTRQ